MKRKSVNESKDQFMNRIGVFYSFRSVKTRQQAQKIVNALELPVEEVDLDHIDREKFMSYTYYILAAPTWFDGELPNYWDEFLPDIENESFKGKKMALFGGGDQKGYPENYVDGIGLLGEFMSDRGAELVGFTSCEGYSFEHSRACVGNQFMGLALDIENQAALTKERITAWGKQLHQAFK